MSSEAHAEPAEGGMDLLIDFHRDADSLGPGSRDTTLHALDLTGIDRAQPLRIADLGCGTGASSLVLAEALVQAQITAVDLLQPFLDRVHERAAQAGIEDRITTLAASIEAVPNPTEPYDLIWSEGAIYNIGFREGLQAWRDLLRPGGLIAVSELSWTTPTRPPEIEGHWLHEYPGIGTVVEKVTALESCGYAPLGFFLLPPSCWLDHYYQPMLDRMDAFLARHQHSEPATALVAAERQEIDLYRRFGEFYSYGFYVAQRL